MEKHKILSVIIQNFVGHHRGRVMEKYKLLRGSARGQSSVGHHRGRVVKKHKALSVIAEAE